MKDIGQILKHFSFNQNEIDIYLANLKLGKATVTKIADKVGMNRTAAYFHIKNLEKRGIIKSTKKDKVLHYNAISPDDLYENIFDVTEDLKSLVPTLRELKKTEDETPVISVVEASKGYLEIYDTLSNLPEKSTFRIIEGSVGAKAELDYLSQEKLYNFFKNIVENNIKTKAIFSEGALSRPSKSLGDESMKIFLKRNWEVSVLPEELLPIKNVVLIYQNKVSFLLPSKTMVVTIEHTAIKDTFKEIFESLYYFGRKQNNPWIQ